MNTKKLIQDQMPLIHQKPVLKKIFKTGSLRPLRSLKKGKSLNGNSSIRAVLGRITKDE